MYILQHRVLLEICTDPLRRCYDGVFAKSELRWSAWSDLGYYDTEEQATAKLPFWRELNDYAVSQRGKTNTLKEFRVIEKENEPISV